MAECIIAFDYGTRFIGAAVGQSITGTASPLPALAAKDGTPNWDQIAALLKEWQPQRLVIGLPLNMDGTPSEMSQRAEKFARRLHGRFGLPVLTWDERLSSYEARGEMLAHSKEIRGNQNFRASGVDSLSARLILESWFAAQTE
ncbi:MAG TPA: Holliday junction resolvase RuvX [Spongiibacteraceae bacterium]|nr:Holliday junction resolvase RuvX [Spongiibacteraceae bacterium]